MIRYAFAGASLLALALIAEASSVPENPMDYQPSPAETRTVESPRGDYRLVLHSLPDQATATLVSTQTPTVTHWQRQLPHQFGPRIAFVGDDGAVALLDEWINIFTDNAIIVINVHGSTLTTYSTNDIAAFLKRSTAEIAAQAKFGPWMMGVPKLSDSADSVLVPMGDETLSIGLSDGALSTTQ